MSVDFRQAAEELILELLKQADQPMTAVEVADRLMIAPSTAFDLLHKMSGYSLVRRVDQRGLIMWKAAQ